MLATLGKPPVIQQPVMPDTDKPRALPPFVMPPTGTDEAKPRVLAISPRVRGKRNPVQAISVGGQDFVQYRLPSSATITGVNPAMIRPNLPVVALTDKQCEALRERAKLLHVTETFYPPDSDTDALRGYQDITADEFIIITDYEPNSDPFALALMALREGEAILSKNDPPKPDPAGADELQKTDNAFRQSNDEPQRGEDKPINGKPKKH